MDDRRFDALTRSLAAGASRRNVLKGMFGGLAGVAVFGGKKAYAEDEEIPESVPETTTDPVVEEPAPVEEAPPVEDTAPPEDAAPPVEEPPAEEPAPADPPVDPPVDTGVETVDEGTPADPSGQPTQVCGEGWTVCGTLCCEPGWRCCGIYCIPDREDSCCADTECDVCEICSLDGVCYQACDAVGLECCVDEENHTWGCANCCYDDPSCGVEVDCDFCHENEFQCCHDDKHNTTYCAHCCDNSDCHDWGACHTCYGGYCLSCFDQTGGTAPICATDQCGDFVASGGGADYCVQCCSHEQCPPCHRCHGGWCEYACDEGEHCCEADLAAAGGEYHGYCATCCSHDDCGGCERCKEGACHYACDKDEVCCHDEYCAPHSQGCCGLSGDWCEDVGPASGLSGYCCDGLRCCFDDKYGSGSCAECCDHYDCPEDWRCCGGTCTPECCDDKDCEWGYCVDGYCAQCRENHDCGKGKICCGGECRHDIECCYENDFDPVNCSDCEICTDGYCRPTGVGLYGICNPMYVATAWDGTPQLNCCDGLVCCDTHKYGLVCLECCGDHDCAEGCSCEEGFCSCGCASDHDCAKGTCCCKNGTCSSDCCAKPPKPDKPAKPASGGTTTVTTLPATGSGDAQQGSGWIGAAAIGAAAAYLASRKLKPEQAPETPTPEE